MPDMKQMDAANKAICFALRHPPQGEKPTALKDIRKVVRKSNGKKPSLQAIAKAAATFQDNCCISF